MASISQRQDIKASLENVDGHALAGLDLRQGDTDPELLMGSLALEKCFRYFHNLLTAELCGIMWE